MSEPIDFSRLTLMDALDLAVLVEDEAKERYQEFADQMEVHHTAEAAGFFRFMVVNESKHGDELAKRRKALFGDAPRRVTRSQLWNVEAPEYEQARAFMTPRQALNVAMQCEVKAHGFFQAALPHLRDPDVKALFTELLHEEIEHQELVKKEIAKLPTAPEGDQEDFADEPVAL
jgi:rubrerythrin